MRWAVLVLLLVLAVPSGAAPPDGAPLLRGLPCTVVVGQAPAATAQPCWATDGDLTRTLPEPVMSCRVVPDRSGLSYRDEVCRQAPVRSLVVDLGRYRPLGLIVLTLDREHDPGRLELDVSYDGVTWDAWTSLLGRRGRSDSALRSPVYGRFLRVRAGSDPEEQPSTSRRLDEGARPTGVPHPEAEVDDWTGTLLGLTELDVQARVTGAPVQEEEVALRPISRYEVAAVALLGVVGLVQVVVLRRPLRAPSGAWPGSVRTVGDSLRSAAQSAAVLAAALAALAVGGLFFVVVPLLGVLLTLGILFLTGPVGLALGGAGVLLLVAALAAAPRPFPRATALLLAASLVVNGGAVAVLLAVDDTVPAPDSDAVAAAPRPLPVAAEPLEVVRTAARLAASTSSAERARSCRLLVRRARDGCRPDGVDADVDPRYVARTPERALVEYDSGSVVRLQHGRSGWELLELPDDRYRASCVDAAVTRGTDPFRCDVGDR